MIDGSFDVADDYAVETGCNTGAERHLADDTGIVQANDKRMINCLLVNFRTISNACIRKKPQTHLDHKSFPP